MPETNLAKMAESVLANMFQETRPDNVSTSAEGTEHIDRADIQLPRLFIAQSLSPEIQEGDPKQIPDLKNGDMFNTLTRQIYGRGPIHFVVLRGDKPRYVEFIPRAEGGGVKDPSVSPDDPRTQFTTDPVTGKRKNPVATKFYDFVFQLFHADGAQETVSCSFKSTGLKVATSLNALLKLRNAPIYEGVYKLTSKQQKNAKGVFFQYTIEPAGWVKDDRLKANLREMFHLLKNKAIEFDTEQRHDETDEDTFEYGANAPAADSPEASM